MAEQIGSMYIDFKADIADLRAAMAEIRGGLKNVGHEARRTTANFDVLGSVITGSVIAMTLQATNAVVGFTKSLVNFAASSPEVRIATAEMNEELRQMAFELGPEAGKTIESFTDLLKTVWPDVSPGLIAFLKWMNTDLIPSLKEAWSYLSGEKSIGKAVATLIKDMFGVGGETDTTKKIGEEMEKRGFKIPLSIRGEGEDTEGGLTPFGKTFGTIGGGPLSPFVQRMLFGESEAFWAELLGDNAAVTGFFTWLKEAFRNSIGTDEGEST